MRATRTLLLVGLVGALAGCAWLDGDGGDHAICVPGLSVAPQPADGVLTLVENQAQPITATLELCGHGDPLDYTFTWTYDEDGNGVLDEQEALHPVAQTPEYTVFACYSDRGQHRIRVAAEPIRGDGEAYELEFDLQIVAAGAPIAKPACYAEAISTVRNANTIDEDAIRQLQSSLDCLQPYLKTALCDFQASYAAALASFAVFNAKTPARWRDRSNMTLSDIRRIYDEEVVPGLNLALVVADKGPEDFQFYVNGKFELKAFDDLEYLEGDETVNITLQGDHDMGEVRGIAAVASATRAAFEMFLAYEGIVDWFLKLPREDQWTQTLLRKALVGAFIDDSTFGNLAPERDGTSGRDRLLAARGGFMDFFGRLEEAVDFVRRETDDQRDDLFRYWDCGSDGLCDCGDANEILLSCPNRGIDYPGPDADGTEGNNRYDPGEPVGTDRLGFPEYTTVDLPSNLDEFIAQIRIIRDNLRGPDPLPLDDLMPGAEFALRSFNIPVPAIRLSEWFLTPVNLRDVVPLYSKSQRDLIFDIESEPYLDLGYDCLADADEKTVHADNPRGSALGTPFDPLTNPDPHYDNLDPFCNPYCTDNDGIDNDCDGLEDGQDRLVADGGFDVYQDTGVENNLVFDWVDLNENFRHDPGEPSECFTDSGVKDYRGRTVNRAGAWDFADGPHTYPSGADVGPVDNFAIVDPPDGIVEDRLQRQGLYADDLGKQAALSYDGLYDSFYFFYVDPTFSGALVFPDEIVSISGEVLGDNAKFQRFVNKVLELLGTLPVSNLVNARRVGDGKETTIRAAYGHVCSNEADCRAAVELVKSNP